MRSRGQMRSTLAEYPAVEEALDGLGDEHGELFVSTLEDFCDRYPDSAPLRRAAVRVSGSLAGWFLVTARGSRVWMVAAEGQAVEITEGLPRGFSGRRDQL
ncbi:MAG: hypothetical protein BGO11_09475 [Solirubrobacterales bacterium 70-9]|nr:MAG: hypothetical protein BGO11_09475 [Solirubrobacterales bacterium 70-9]